MDEKLSEQLRLIENDVRILLENDISGHGFDHIERVVRMATKFAKSEGADVNIVSLIALLHDADDYKLFGEENAEELANAKVLLDRYCVNQNIQNQVLSEISNIGYSKRLAGKQPQTIEGKVVSDADMLDATGVIGFVRSHAYSLSVGRPFFNKDVYPELDLTAEIYKNKTASTANNSTVCHAFEKMLKIKDLMLTASGAIEAESRHQIVIDILKQYFKEENVPEWDKYLDDYISGL